VDRLTGKITSLSSDQGSGVLATVAGSSLTFTFPDSVGAAGFSEGQIVTYRDVNHGSSAPGAGDVRATV
jgi:hypothetical protein